jgi:hypothetical protein
MTAAGIFYGKPWQSFIYLYDKVALDIVGAGFDAFENGMSVLLLLYKCIIQSCQVLLCENLFPVDNTLAYFAGLS